MPTLHAVLLLWSLGVIATGAYLGPGVLTTMRGITFMKDNKPVDGLPQSMTAGVAICFIAVCAIWPVTLPLMLLGNGKTGPGK